MRLTIQQHVGITGIVANNLFAPTGTTHLTITQLVEDFNLQREQ